MNNSRNDYLPNNMSLWKVVGNSDHYFLFPNDTLIIRYELRKWNMTDHSEGTDFHADQIFVRIKPQQYCYYHGHNKLDTEITVKEHNKNGSIKLVVKHIAFQDSIHYLLEPVDSFENLPSDPRVTYKSYLDKLYNDTLVRFSSKTEINHLIYSFRGEDTDTLTLKGYNKKPNYPGISENDTLFQALENEKIYVIPKGSSFDAEILGKKGSFDIEKLNRADSISMAKLLSKIDSLNGE